MIWDFRSASQRQRGIRVLAQHQGKGTHLVSVYVSSNPANALQRIKDEESRLGNIKSKATQKIVERALSRVHLALTHPPEAPFAIFASQDVCYTCILPATLARDNYTCGKHFEYQCIQDHSESRWGLVVSDTLQTSVGVWQNGRIRVLGHYQYWVPGKIKAGGQSSQRFEQKRMNMVQAMLRQVTQKISTHFLQVSVSKIFVGGVSPVSERLMTHPGIHPPLRALLVGPFSVCYTNPSGLDTLIQRVSQQHADLLQMYLRQEQEFKKLVAAMAQGRAGSLLQYRGVPLQNPHYYLVQGVDYHERYCPTCRMHDTSPCGHPTTPLNSLAGAYWFKPGGNADFIRKKYRGMVIPR